MNLLLSHAIWGWQRDRMLRCKLAVHVPSGHIGRRGLGGSHRLELATAPLLWCDIRTCFKVVSHFVDPKLHSYWKLGPTRNTAPRLSPPCRSRPTT